MLGVKAIDFVRSHLQARTAAAAVVAATCMRNNAPVSQPDALSGCYNGRGICLHLCTHICLYVCAPKCATQSCASFYVHSISQRQGCRRKLVFFLLLLLACIELFPQRFPERTERLGMRIKHEFAHAHCCLCAAATKVVVPSRLSVGAVKQSTIVVIAVVVVVVGNPHSV